MTIDLENIIFSEHYLVIGDPLTREDHIYELAKIDSRANGDPILKNCYKYVDLDIISLKRIYESKF